MCHKPAESGEAASLFLQITSSHYDTISSHYDITSVSYRVQQTLQVKHIYSANSRTNTWERPSRSHKRIWTEWSRQDHGRHGTPGRKHCSTPCYPLDRMCSRSTCTIMPSSMLLDWEAAWSKRSLFMVQPSQHSSQPKDCQSTVAAWTFSKTNCSNSCCQRLPCNATDLMH